VELLLLLYAKCHFLFVIHLLFLSFSLRAYIPVSYIVYTLRACECRCNNISKLRAYPWRGIALQVCERASIAFRFSLKFPSLHA